MANSERNNNAVPSLQVKSNAGNGADVVLWGDPSTHRLLVDATVSLSIDAQFTDDAAFTVGSSKVLAIGAMFDDTTPDSIDEGDVGIPRMSANRNMYFTIRDAAGNERGANVNASGQLAVAGPVTNAGTFAVQVDGAALTALQLIDDVIIADDAAFTPGSTKVAMAGFQVDETGTDSVDEGDAGAARMSANRNIFVQLRDSDGNERGLKVDSDGKIAVTISTIPSHAVTNAGTFAVQVDGAALTALQLIDDTVYADDAAFTPGSSKVLGVGFMVDDTGTDSVDEGDIGAPRMSADRVIYVQGATAADAADAGNPLKVGGKAISAEITPVTANDRSNLHTDLAGKLIVLPYANPENFVSGTTAAMTGTTSTQLLAAPAGSLRNYITHIIVTNSHATVSTFVTIRDGDGGTVLYQAYALAAGGGFSITFPTPLRQPTAATRLDVKNETTGANVIANASGYKGV